jgi:hypothetical protein
MSSPSELEDSMAEVKSQGAVEAMEVAEASRQTEWEKPSFVGDLFLGNLNLDLIHPFPEQPAADKAEADEFLHRLERYLAENVDADEIDRRQFAMRRCAHLRRHAESF